LKIKITFPNLDGLRFFCFLSVFLFHSFHTKYEHIKAEPLYQFIKFDLFGNGNLGVNFFFVLSGFLITYLLIVEKNSTGINIKNFYLRRVLRIWPLFFFCVFFGFAIFPFIKNFFGEESTESANLIYYLLFINNFDFIKNHPDASVLGVLWSVAIEEQFYFVWPLILTILPIRKHPAVFMLVIIQSIIFRWIHPTFKLHEYHTLSCIGDMAVGALGAWLVLYRNKFRIHIENLPKLSIGVIYLSVSIIFFFRKELFQSNDILVSFERTLIAFMFLFVILEQNYAKSSFFKLSNLKWVSLLGKRTYGLYCYCLHFIGILVATKITHMLNINTHLWQVLIVDTTFSFLLTLLIAEISYRIYEMPFLRLKGKFSYVTQ